jgi:hypothetical protein
MTAGNRSDGLENCKGDVHNIDKDLLDILSQTSKVETLVKVKGGKECYMHFWSSGL